jgi:hypothetical protein
MRPTRIAALLAVLGAFSFSVARAVAQESRPMQPSGGPAAAPDPATASAELPGAAATPPSEAGRTPILAKVIEVEGDVKFAAPDAADWKPVELNASFPEGTRILTGVRSRVKFQIGEEEPFTALLVDSVGLTVLSEAGVSGDTKRVRVGVGYGRIRAGVAEGGLKSEFQVDSPVATLSKRGTWGFSLFYERGSDLFEISLTERGLVEALRNADLRSRTIRPGEAVSNALRRWLDEAPLRKNVAIPDILGQGDIEVAFNRIRTDGVGVLGVGSGRSAAIDFNPPGARDQFVNRINQIVDAPPLNLGGGLRPEGFFGTGRGDDLVQLLLDSRDPLVTSGAAKPGKYLLRRGALQSFLGRK